MSKRFEEIGESEFDRQFYSFFHFAVGAFSRHILKTRAEGLENVPEKGRAILAFNHLHWFDILLVPASIPDRHITLVGRRKMMELPVAKWMFNHWGAITVDRGIENPGREALEASMENMAKPLREERLLGMFASPNTRTPGQKPGQPVGVDRLAFQTQTNVIPGVVKGTDKLGDRHTVLKLGESIGYPESPKERREFRRHLQDVQTDLFDSIDHPGIYLPSK